MSDSAEYSTAQHLAGMCLPIVLDPEGPWPLGEAELGPLQETLGADMSAADMANFGQRLRETERFRQGREQIASRWRRRWPEGQLPDERQALKFLDDFFSLVDHRILFDQGITASSMYMRRGRATVSELNFPGGMPCWTLHLTTGGEGLYLNNRIELESTRGHLMLFHPEAHYHYGLAPAAQEWEHLWALFQPRAHWAEWLAWEALDDGIFHMVSPDENSTDELEALFRQLIQLKNQSAPFRSDLEHNRLEEILIRARGLQQLSVKRQQRDRRIIRACEYMESHLQARFCVDDVAGACNLSSSRLAHLFKQEMGVGPKAWSNNLRLQQARKFLLNSNDAIAGIAEKVGYEDPAQFTRNFRRNVGCSPREFRKSFSATATGVVRSTSTEL